MLDCFVVCDLETTGTDPRRDEIIEVCLLKVQGGVVTERLETLVRPVGPLPPVIESLTGISPEMLAGAPSWEEVLPRVRAFTGGLPLLAHNASFDASFLARQDVRGFGPVLDTAVLARIVLPTAPSYRLDALCRLLGIRRDVHHRAAADAAAALELLDALRGIIASLGPELVGRVAEVLSRGGSPWREAFTGTSARTLPVRPPDREAPEPAGEKAPAELPPFGAETVASFFAPGGGLARLLPQYEYRDQQVRVARAVADALEKGKVLLVEAGTGTGKSLAYLLPAALWATGTGERVVISTHTINLQDQLLRKDIPLVRQLVGRPLRAALLKGRPHYLCLHRWTAALARADLQPDVAHFYARLLVWLATTGTGDVGEMHLTPDERRLWQEVRAAPEGCAGMPCDRPAACFVARARRAAERAHLVIINHALLLSDLKDGGLLPPYGPLILDEAHHLEDTATNLFGYSLRKGEVAVWLTAAAKIAGGGRSARSGEDPAAAFFDALGEAARAAASPDAPEVRLMPGARNLDPDGLVGDAFVRLREALHASRVTLERSLGELRGAGAPAQKELAVEAARLITAGEDLQTRLELLFGGKDPNLVVWVETGRDAPGECVLRAAPIEVADILYTRLFRARRPVVLTSATLTAEGTFAFFKERTGLDRLKAGEVAEVAVSSPFPFREQALLCVASDVPEPPPGEAGEYMEAVAACIAELAEAVPGKMLVLCTAHRLLQGVHARLAAILPGRGIAVLGHGVDGGRSRLLQEFNAEKRAVLLGAASFWEGVDLPGEALQCVVVVRLPFMPPGTPLVEARQEALSRRGCDHFARMAVPQAVIRFRQGFGRLIRTRRDRGVVVVLDTRLLTRGYGRKFLASLPPVRVYAAATREVARAAAAWLRGDTFSGGTQ